MTYYTNDPREASFHKAIKPFCTKRIQGYIMGAWRESLGDYDEVVKERDELRATVDALREQLRVSAKSTPAGRWRENGEEDAHGARYDCERADLCMGDFTDDELANAVFLHGNGLLTIEDMKAGKPPAIAYLTAAKDRIRWLSRKLHEVLTEKGEREGFELWIKNEGGPEAAKRWPTSNGPGYANDRVQDYRTGWVECLAWLRRRASL